MIKTRTYEVNAVFVLVFIEEGKEKEMIFSTEAARTSRLAELNEDNAAWAAA